VNSVYLDLVFQIIKRKRNRPISFICVPYLGNRFVIACLSWWENYGGRWEWFCCLSAGVHAKAQSRRDEPQSV